MSAQSIAFANGGLTWWRAVWLENPDRLKVTEVDGRTYELDRDQAHLLMLYLQDKLGYHGLRRVTCPECGMSDPPHHKPGCNFGAAVAK